MKKLSLTALSLATLAFSLQAKEAVGTVISVKGDSQIAQGLSPKRPVAVGDQVFKMDKIKTDADGEVVIDMNGSSKITVGPGSYFKIQEQNDKNTSLNLYSGQVKAKVEKRSSDQQFTLKTPTAVAGVRGTEFATIVDPGMNTITVTNQGEVWSAEPSFAGSPAAEAASAVPPASGPVPPPAGAPAPAPMDAPAGSPPPPPMDAPAGAPAPAPMDAPAPAPAAPALEVHAAPEPPPPPGVVEGAIASVPAGLGVVTAPDGAQMVVAVDPAKSVEDNAKSLAGMISSQKAQDALGAKEKMNDAAVQAWLQDLEERLLSISPERATLVLPEVPEPPRN